MYEKVLKQLSNSWHKRIHVFAVGVHRYLWRLFVAIVLILMGCAIALKTETVQNLLVQKAAEYLSKELHTTVKIKRLYFDWFTGVDLDGLYIADLKGDTLIYAGSLTADWEMLALRNREIKLQHIALNDAFVDIHPHDNEPTNLQFVLDYFNPEKSKNDTAKHSIILSELRNVQFNRTRFWYKNSEQGIKIIASIPVFNAQLNSINTATMVADIEQLILDKPVVYITKIPRKIPVLTSKKDKKEENAAIVKTLMEEEKGKKTTDVIKVLKDYFRLKHFNLIDGEVVWKDETSPFSQNIHCFNPYNIDTRKVNLRLTDFEYQKQSLNGNIEHISAIESNSNLQLHDLHGNLKVKEGNIVFKNFKLSLNNSTIGDSVAFQFEKWADFKHFDKNVFTKVYLHNTHIVASDVLQFLPDVCHSPLAEHYKNETVSIEGGFMGNIERLAAHNLKLGIAEHTELAGDVTLRDILNPQAMLLTGNLDYFRTNNTDLKRLLPPNVPLPKEIEKLGKIAFSGKCNGFLQDFYVEGNLATDIGQLRTAMHLDLHSKPDDFTYKGDIVLTDFDLEKLTDNKNLGIVNLTANIDGQGTKPENLHARVTANIGNIVLNKYDYKGLTIDGLFDKKKFVGKAGIHEKNVDISILGNADFTNTDTPILDVNLTVPRADLHALNLTAQKWVVSTTGNVKLKGKNIDDIEASIDLSRLWVQHDTTTVETKNIRIVAQKDSVERRLTIDSDMLRGSVVGNFQIAYLPVAFADYFQRNFPSYTDKLGIKVRRNDTIVSKRGLITITEKPLLQQNAFFNLEIRDTKNALELIGGNVRIAPIKNLTVRGNFDNASDKLAAAIVQPASDSLTVNNITVRDIEFNLYGKDEGRNSGEIEFGLGSIRIGKNLKISRIKLGAIASKDQVSFTVAANEVIKEVQGVFLRGTMSMQSDYLSIKMDTAYAKIYGEEWRVAKNNFIQFRGDTVKTDNFYLRNGNQSIGLKSSGKKGLYLKVNNLRAGWISREIVNKEGKKILFDGVITGVVGLEDYFKGKDLYAGLKIDSLSVNGLKWGNLNLQARADTLNGKYELLKETVLTDNDGNELKINGSYYNAGVANLANLVDLHITTEKYSAAIAKLFLKNDISNVKGNVKVNLSLKGKVIIPADERIAPTLPDLSGTVDITDAAVTIDFLKVHILSPSIHAVANNSLIDITGTKIYDEMGNQALIKGGIAHKHFFNWGPAIQITSNRFMILNTKRGDNNTFYGKGIGDNLKIDITGTFDKTDMEIRATTEIGTNIVFPLYGSGEVKTVNFITFKSPVDSVDAVEKSDRYKQRHKIVAKEENSGLALSMNLEITPRAKFELVFDEATGEKMQSTGEGNMSLKLSRQGDFTMTGKYEIVSGSYLFIYQALQLNKPFAVKPGGTINWEGSPYDATISLTAQYKDLRVAPYPLLEEYINNNTTAAAEAKKSTEIDLDLMLTGSLLKPDVAFKIGMPNISSSLRSYWQTKQHLLEDDPNLMNRQIFGLMVMRSFLPQQDGISAVGLVTSSLANTVTEMISSQLSNYVNDILSEVAPGFNVGVNYKFYDPNQDVPTPSNGSGGNPVVNSLSSSELQLDVKRQLFDNRLLLDVGGSFVGLGNSTINNGTYFAGNFAMEYLISADGRFKVRAYVRPEQNALQNNVLPRYGAGLSYRREFNSLDEFFGSMKKSIKTNN